MKDKTENTYTEKTAKKAEIIKKKFYDPITQREDGTRIYTPHNPRRYADDNPGTTFFHPW